MKKILLFLVLGIGFGVALAQAADAPKDWGEAINALLLLIPAIIATIAKGPKYWLSLLKDGTFWAAVGGIATAVKYYASGNLSLEGLVFAIIGGLTAILLRKGMHEAEEKAAAASASPMIRK